MKMMKSNRKHASVIIALMSAGVMWIGAQAIAEETTGEKIESKVEATTNNAKEAGRKAKKKIRKATGNESVTEDLKDGAKNVSDDIEHGVKKTKRKLD
jgi:hypothetical protein